MPKNQFRVITLGDFSISHDCRCTKQQTQRQSPIPYRQENMINYKQCSATRHRPTPTRHEITTIEIRLRSLPAQPERFEAVKPYSSQPGISKQIKLLEEEIGIQIFIRSGKRVVSVSQPGKVVWILRNVFCAMYRTLKYRQRVYRTGQRFADGCHDAYAGALCPTVDCCRFCETLSESQSDHQTGSPAAIAQMVTSGESDLAIVTERIDDHPELGRLSCYDWTRGGVPNDHPLLECRNPPY